MTVSQAGQDEGDPPLHSQPAWAVNAGVTTSFLHGLRSFYQLPAIVLFATALGYGALSRDVGLSLGQTSRDSAP